MIKLKFIDMDVRDPKIWSEGACKISVNYCYICKRDILTIYRQAVQIKPLEDSWKTEAYRNYCIKHGFKTYNIILRNTVSTTCTISNVILSDEELSNLIDKTDD